MEMVTVVVNGFGDNCGLDMDSLVGKAFDRAPALSGHCVWCMCPTAVAASKGRVQCTSATAATTPQTLSLLQAVTVCNFMESLKELTIL